MYEISKNKFNKKSPREHYRHLSLPGLLLLWWNTVIKSNLGQKGFTWLTLTTSPFIIKGSQERNSNKTRTWTQKLMQRTWKGAVYWVVPHDLISLLSSWTQGHQPRVTLTPPINTVASTRYSLDLVCNTAFVCWLAETLSRRFYLKDAGVLLITTNVSSPATQHWVSQKSKGFNLVVLVPC